MSAIAAQQAVAAGKADVEMYQIRSNARIRQMESKYGTNNVQELRSKMTPEEIVEDRDKFVATVMNEVNDDFRKLGLVIDSVNIQNVHDEDQYLESIARKASAEVRRGQACSMPSTGGAAGTAPAVTTTAWISTPRSWRKRREQRLCLYLGIHDRRPSGQIVRSGQ